MLTPDNPKRVNPQEISLANIHTIGDLLSYADFDLNNPAFSINSELTTQISVTPFYQVSPQVLRDHNLDPTKALTCYDISKAVAGIALSTLAGDGVPAKSVIVTCGGSFIRPDTEPKDFDIHLLVYAGTEEFARRGGDYEAGYLESKVERKIRESIAATLREELGKHEIQVEPDLRVFTSPFGETYFYAVTPTILFCPSALVVVQTRQREDAFLVKTLDEDARENYERYKTRKLK